LRYRRGDPEVPARGRALDDDGIGLHYHRSETKADDDHGYCEINCVEPYPRWISR
jgi:hypothetical protein